MTTLSITGVTAPNPANLTATSKRGSVKLEWDNPFDEAYKITEIWRSTSNNRTNASKVYETIADWWEDSGLNFGQTYYYWIRTKSIYDRTDGDWHPTSSTAGVQGSTDSSVTGSIGGGSGSGSTSSFTNGWWNIDDGNASAYEPAVTIDSGRVLLTAGWTLHIAPNGTYTGTEEFKGYFKVYVEDDQSSVTDSWTFGSTTYPIWHFDANGTYHDMVYLPFSRPVNATMLSTRDYKCKLDIYRWGNDGTEGISYYYDNDASAFSLL